jgi:DNA-binding LacI/PurR family transcriptional regulator
MRDRRASLLLGSLTHDGEYDPSGVRSWFEERRVDGAIFLRPRKSERPLIEAVRRQGIAYSVVASDVPAKGGFELRSDNVLGGRLLASHLVEFGHKRFAYVGGERSSRDSQERLSGIEQVLRQSGHRLLPRDIVEGSFETDDGRAYAKRWLKRRAQARPTAVLFGDDTMALGFVGSLLKAGIDIPRQVSVTGFNDIPASSWIWPGLTTVSQELVHLGAAACDKVLRATTGGSELRLTRSETFPVELIRRQTTGPAPRR